MADVYSSLRGTAAVRPRYELLLQWPDCKWLNEWRKHSVLALVAVCFVLLASVTIWLCWSATQEAHRLASERFTYRVAESRDAVRQRLLAYEQVLRGGTAFFAAAGEVTRRDWWAYVDHLDLGTHFPGIQAMAYSPRIRRAGLAAFTSKVRADGFPDYAIRPTGDRDEYVPVEYIEPFNWRNRRAFGFDLITEPVRREALLRARDTAAPAMTGKITLKQETSQGVQHGFLMCAPVFPAGEVPASLDARRLRIVGYICAVFRLNDLMHGIFGPVAQPDIRLQIFDGVMPTPQNALYDSGIGRANSANQSAMFVTNEGFDFDGRRWTLRLSSTPAFDGSIDVQKPRILLSGGLLVSVLFTMIVWSAAQNRRRAREISEANSGLKQLTSDLQLAKNAAEAANQAKSDFLANVSHELRTPLTLILAPTQQLNACAVPPSNWHTHIERIERNALLLLNRVNDLLDFSKAEAGKFQVHWENVNIKELVAPLAEDAAVAANSKGCSLTWTVDAAVDVVAADPRHLERILLNLLSNAIKFTPTGGWVRLEVKPIGEASYEMAVVDSGIGIPPDRLQSVFERFNQVDTSATRQYSGSGIGLALVKELAHLMEGEVGVQSELGQGSRFFVRLPCKHCFDAICASDSGEAVSPDGTGASLRLARFEEATTLATRTPAEQLTNNAEMPSVLVADDNPDMRHYIAGLLQDECHVMTAADGLEAWSLLQHQPVDVVVSDVMMPGLDGASLAARIKADEVLSHVPVILVTARGGAEASAAGLESGADDYIAKPFSPLELRARVRAALRMKMMQEQLREASRQSGMSMLAASILHNLGNILNGITVSSSLIYDRLRHSRVDRLPKVTEALQKSKPTGENPALLTLLDRLTDNLGTEHQALLDEVANLRECTEHAVAVIAAQRSFAKPGRKHHELISASQLMDQALKLSQPLNTVIERNYGSDATVLVDRHMALQILLNLLANAREALQGLPAAKRLLNVHIERIDHQLRIEVCDNGVGIDEHNLASLFNQGFTTKAEGRGLGLHSSAVWARELGGTLTCRSSGPGCGATFTLELPCRMESESDGTTFLIDHALKGAGDA